MLLVDRMTSSGSSSRITSLSSKILLNSVKYTPIVILNPNNKIKTINNVKLMMWRKKERVRNWLAKLQEVFAG